MNDLHENTIIEWFDEEYNTKSLERILWISLEDDVVFVINIDDEDDKENKKKNEKGALPYARSYEEIINSIKNNTARKFNNEPFMTILNPGKEYLKKHSANRDKYWEALKDILQMEPEIFIDNKRGPLIKGVSSDTGISERDIYKKIKQFWKYGKTPNALMPLYIKSGGKGKPKKVGEKKLGRTSKKGKLNPQLVGVNVTEEDKKIFRLAIQLFYKSSNKPSLKSTYDKMKAKFYNQGFHIVNGVKSPILPNKEEIPNLRQFKYWYNNEYDSKEKAEQRYGKKNQQLKHRSFSSNATKRAGGPGAVFEIDATIADIYLVSSLVRHRIIGRPVIYIVKDVFSRMVTGVYVGLVGPSWEAAMLALENVTTNKKEYCMKLNIPISDDEWPSHHLPKAITADRGEFEGSSVDNYINELGVRINNTPPYRADLKGIVEQHFNVINTKIKEWAPGAVHKDYMERGARDYRLDAKLTLKAFERIIVLSILEHNKRIINNYPLSAEMIKAGVEPTPINLWQWGMKRNGTLKEVDRNLVRSTLMPSAKASVTRRGLCFKGKDYYSSYAKDQGWCDEVAEKGRKKVEVYFDNRNANFVYLLKDDGTFDECPLINKLEFSDDELEPRMEDVEEYEYASTLNEDINEFEYEQVTVDINAQIEKTIEEETEKTSKSQIPGQSNASKLDSIKQNRNAEIEDIRKTGTMVGSAETTNNSVKYKRHEELSDLESRDYKKSVFNMLKQQSEKRGKAQ